MCQNGTNRLTLYERPPPPAKPVRYSEENGVGVFYWSDQDFGYALAAKADRQKRGAPPESRRLRRMMNRDRKHLVRRERVGRNFALGRSGLRSLVRRYKALASDDCKHVAGQAVAA